MKKIFKIIIITLVFFALTPFLEKAQAAAFNFDQATVSVANGGTFQIAVTVDPAGENLSSVDAYVTYDATLLKANSVTAGSLFPTVSHDESTSGKVYIAGMVNDPATSVSTAGTLATITFQALNDGSGILSFDCNSSKIIKNDINATNVIACAQNGTSTVTVGSGSGSAAGSTTPTVAAADTGVSQLPQSGIFNNLIKFAIPGAILLILGSALRLIL
jgi:hypothetical protein